MGFGVADGAGEDAGELGLGRKARHESKTEHGGPNPGKRTRHAANVAPENRNGQKK
jgi:hypothetical protein